MLSRESLFVSEVRLGMSWHIRETEVRCVVYGGCMA